MPTSLSYGEIMEMWRYGEFTKATIAFQIPKEYAVSFPAILSTPIHTVVPAVDLKFYIKEQYIGILDKLCAGDTSRPGKIYLEFYIGGYPYPTGATSLFAPAFQLGYKSGAYIRLSCNTSENPYIISDYAQFKFWNTTGDAPENVYFESCLWYYTFQKKYYKEVYDILMRDWVLSQKIISLLEALIAQNAGKLDDDLLAEIIAKSKKPFRSEVVVTYG